MHVPAPPTTPAYSWSLPIHASPQKRAAIGGMSPFPKFPADRGNCRARGARDATSPAAIRRLIIQSRSREPVNRSSMALPFR